MINSEKAIKPSVANYVLVILFVYIVVIGSWTLTFNAQGGDLVQGWYAEYVGEDNNFSGSGEWRTPTGKAFQEFALLFSIWVYPFSLIVFLQGFRTIKRSDRLSVKFLSVVAIAGVGYVLYRFMSIGLLSAVLG